jgi:hypothetical protein
VTAERRDAAATEQECRTLKKAMVLVRAHVAPVEIVVFLSAALGVADAIRTEGEEET